MKSIEEYENPQLFAINFLEIRLEIFPAKECNHYTVNKQPLSLLPRSISKTQLRFFLLILSLGTITNLPVLLILGPNSKGSKLFVIISAKFGYNVTTSQDQNSG